MIFRTSDPVLDALRWDAEQDEKREEWLKDQPFCMLCDERIETDHCYIVDDYYAKEACICKTCMDGQKDKLKKANINTGLREALEEYIETMWGRTPREEWC